MAQILDGKKIAADQLEHLKQRILDDSQKSGRPPCLAVILVGDDPASHVYVSHKIKACHKTGIRSLEYFLPASADEADIRGLIETLNADGEIDGILLQLPLPSPLDGNAIVQSIAPEKDVDGLTLLNSGKWVAGDSTGLIPCTPQGAMALIKTANTDLSGKMAIVIGRSLLFGKPMGQLLLSENCTVIQAHSKTKNLPDLCRQCDIVVAAVGRAGLVKADWIKSGAIVIDVGINRMEDGTLKGDVDFKSVQNVAGYITPVPGGVGPMTISYLMENTAKAARKNGVRK
jgi:methylenetetrahydrofolate dehydrogenase (NADP+) / methenyltetrahydrofolate cyclohydrolase